MPNSSPGSLFPISSTQRETYPTPEGGSLPLAFASDPEDQSLGENRHLGRNGHIWSMR
jgi:hypothetical protein